MDVGFQFDQLRALVTGGTRGFGKEIAGSFAEAGAQVAPTLEQGVGAWQGRVANLASIAGLFGHPGRNAYRAAKAGVVMMTRTLVAEWG